MTHGPSPGLCTWWARPALPKPWTYRTHGVIRKCTSPQAKRAHGTAALGGGSGQHLWQLNFQTAWRKDMLYHSNQPRRAWLEGKAESYTTAGWVCQARERPLKTHSLAWAAYTAVPWQGAEVTGHKAPGWDGAPEGFRLKDEALRPSAWNEAIFSHFLSSFINVKHFMFGSVIHHITSLNNKQYSDCINFIICLRKKWLN